MQQFDTMTLVFPPDAVRGRDSKSWIDTVQTDGSTGEKIRMWQAKPEKSPIGVSRITYREGGEYMLTMSAKVLGGDYLDGITRDNWYRGLEAVAPILEVDPDLVYGCGGVSRCDTTNNISLEAIEATAPEVCKAVLAGKRNVRFLGIYWHNKKQEGLELRGTQQEKNRMLLYSKSKDLMKKDNIPFLRSIKDPMRLIEKAENQIRIEVNHTSHKSIRDRLGISDIKLQSLLDSTKPANRDFLNKVLKPSKAGAPKIDLFTKIEEFMSEYGSGRDFEKFYGRQQIIKDADYEESVLKQVYQNIYPNENTFKNHWFKGHMSVKRVLDVMKCQQHGLSVEFVERVCEKLLDQLYLSVVAAA